MIDLDPIQRTPAVRREVPAREPEPRSRIDGVTLAILLAGMVPIIGFLLLGHWPQGDLAVASLFVLFALYQFIAGR